MRPLFAALTALSLSVPGFAHAQEQAIPGVIESQITAFQRDDFSRAFDYASPTIKRLFGTPERFGRMVRDGYPMVYRPSEVDMLNQRRVGERVIQRVMIRDGEGRLHFLDYQMLPTEDGWQINGVMIVQAPEVGA